MTVSPVQFLISLSHEMRLEIDLCPTQVRFMSNSPVSWCGVPVGAHQVAAAAATHTHPVIRWTYGKRAAAAFSPSGGLIDQAVMATTVVAPVGAAQ